jgi:hypothetical protein
MQSRKSTHESRLQWEYIFRADAPIKESNPKLVVLWEYSLANRQTILIMNLGFFYP